MTILEFRDTIIIVIITYHSKNANNIHHGNGRVGGRPYQMSEVESISTTGLTKRFVILVASIAIDALIFNSPGVIVIYSRTLCYNNYNDCTAHLL